MNFNIKMDDSKISIDLTDTRLKNVLQYCKPKEQLVLVRKFGLLTGWKEVPLQRIGKDYNLTRERVRQIEAQALMRVRRLMVGNATYIDLIEDAKKILKEEWWILVEDAMITKIINLKKYEFSRQEIKLILVSDFDVTYLKRNKNFNKCFYIDPLFEDFLTILALYTKDYFSQRAKSVDIYEFALHLKDNFVKQYDQISFLKNDQFYLNFFESLRDMKMFDGKLGTPDFVDVYPKTIKLKILYTMRRYNKPVHFQELPAKIMDHFPEKNIKVNTVHNELVKNNDYFVNLGLGLYGLKEWWFKGGTVVDIIVRIFQQHQRPMSVKEISKELLKEKMVSPNTILLNLQKYKWLFERTDKGVYQLQDKYMTISEEELREYVKSL